jgi:hypothetical protein
MTLNYVKKNDSVTDEILIKYKARHNIINNKKFEFEFNDDVFRFIDFSSVYNLGLIKAFEYSTMRMMPRTNQQEYFEVLIPKILSMYLEDFDDKIEILNGIELQDLTILIISAFVDGYHVLIGGMQERYEKCKNRADCIDNCQYCKHNFMLKVDKETLEVSHLDQDEREQILISQLEDMECANKKPC